MMEDLYGRTTVMHEDVGDIEAVSLGLREDEEE